MMTNTTSEGRASSGFWILLATILASSMAFIDGSALNVALDALQKDLRATGADLLWIVNAYSLVVAALLLLGGSLGDHLGRKRIFRLGIIIFSVSSMVCGLSPNVGVMIAARAVQGIGGAFMIPGSLAIISASFPQNRVGQAIGTWSSFSTITTIGGPIIGGVLASHGLWRAIFFINVPLAILAIYALTKVPESRDEEASSHMDYPGAVLVALGLAGITYGTIDIGRGYGASVSTFSIVTLMGGLIALVLFVVVEARSPNPMVKLSLFKSRTFSGTNLMTLFLYGALSGALLFLPLNLIQIQGYPADIAGMTFLPFAILLAFLSPFMGRVVDRMGPRLPLIVGPAIVGVAFILLSLPGITSGPSTYWTTFLPGIIGLGVGMGITVAPLTTAVMGAVPSHQAGIASGINNAVSRSAGVIAVAIFGAIALSTFSIALTAHTEPLELPDSAQQALRQEASNLGNAHVPGNLDADTQNEVKQAIQLSFVDMFRRVVYIAAGLAWLSALVSAVLVANPQKKKAAALATASSP
jgi:EmrB/QacA subfamily drug resistance transporter